MSKELTEGEKDELREEKMNRGRKGWSEIRREERMKEGKN